MFRDGCARAGWSTRCGETERRRVAAVDLIRLYARPVTNYLRQPGHREQPVVTAQDGGSRHVGPRSKRERPPEVVSDCGQPLHSASSANILVEGPRVALVVGRWPSCVVEARADPHLIRALPWRGIMAATEPSTEPVLDRRRSAPHGGRTTARPRPGLAPIAIDHHVRIVRQGRRVIVNRQVHLTTTLWPRVRSSRSTRCQYQPTSPAP